MSAHNSLLLRHSDSPSTRIFKVTNVDNNGEDRNPGYIEITTDSLVLHQRNKEPISWPLHGLRRYGFDADLFSFESGRRCPTGPGIYAFRCRRAEALFNLLQNSIVIAGQSSDAAARRSGGAVDSTWLRSGHLAAGSTTPNNSQMMMLQPVAVVRPVGAQLTLSQYRNVPDNQPASLAARFTQPSLARLPDILANQQQQQQHTDDTVHYAELDLNRHVDEEEYREDEDDMDVFDADDRMSGPRRSTGSSSRFYVNMPAANGQAQPVSNGWSSHGYANIDLLSGSDTAGCDSTAGAAKVNYIQLDLSTETVDGVIMSVLCRHQQV